MGNKLEKSRRLLSGKKKINLEPSGEGGILLIKALCGLERVASNVNVPSTGLQVGNPSAEVVVETNTVSERDAIHPILTGPLPECVRELTMPAMKNHKAVLEAALTCDKGPVVWASMNDPQAKDRKCREQDIRQGDMLDGTKKYLPKGWK